MAQFKLFIVISRIFGFPFYRFEKEISWIRIVAITIPMLFWMAYAWCGFISFHFNLKFDGSLVSTITFLMTSALYVTIRLLGLIAGSCAARYLAEIDNELDSIEKDLQEPTSQSWNNKSSSPSLTRIQEIKFVSRKKVKMTQAAVIAMWIGSSLFYAVVTAVPGLMKGNSFQFDDVVTFYFNMVDFLIPIMSCFVSLGFKSILEQIIRQVKLDPPPEWVKIERSLKQTVSLHSTFQRRTSLPALLVSLSHHLLNIYEFYLFIVSLGNSSKPASAMDVEYMMIGAVVVRMLIIIMWCSITESVEKAVS